MSKHFLFTMRAVCAFAVAGVISSAVHADEVYTGFEAYSNSAVTASDPGVTTGPSTNSFSAGGELRFAHFIHNCIWK